VIEVNLQVTSSLSMHRMHRSKEISACKDTGQSSPEDAAAAAAAKIQRVADKWQQINCL
jgi:hypothetical protein